MKEGDKVLCIKDFKDYFQKGKYYKINHVQKDWIEFDWCVEYIVVSYPYTDYQKDYMNATGVDVDNRVLFGQNFKFDEYFSDRKAKLDKINEKN